MYLTGPQGTQIWTDSNRNFTLRQYGRLEFGSSDVGWLVASARASRPPRGSRRTWGMRLRYFLNSFRGFAAFDVRGPEPGH